MTKRSLKHSVNLTKFIEQLWNVKDTFFSIPVNYLSWLKEEQFATGRLPEAMDS